MWTMENTPQAPPFLDYPAKNKRNNFLTPQNAEWPIFCKKLSAFLFTWPTKQLAKKHPPPIIKALILCFFGKTTCGPMKTCHKENKKKHKEKTHYILGGPAAIRNKKPSFCEFETWNFLKNIQLLRQKCQKKWLKHFGGIWGNNVEFVSVEKSAKNQKLQFCKVK